MFIAYVRQAEGCDYTIGCGRTLWRLDALTCTDAIDELMDTILDEYQGENKIGEVTLFEVVSETDMPVLSWYRYAEARERAVAVMMTDNAERAEFERLKAKFG